MNESISYTVNYREEYGDKRREVIYDGTSLLRAYRAHDDLVQELRMTGPLSNVSVSKVLHKEDGGTVTSYLQLTQIKQA